MVATLGRSPLGPAGMSWAERWEKPRPRCGVRRAVQYLTEALHGPQGRDDSELERRMRVAEGAAVAAEIRIAELENMLEEARRHARRHARILAGAGMSPEHRPRAEEGNR